MRPILDPRDFTSADLQREALVAVTTWDRGVPPDRSDVAFEVAAALASGWDRGSWPGERFAEKVGRALDRLVRRGALVREKGVWQGRGFIAFFTPAQVEVRTRQAVDAEQAAAAAQRRFAAVQARAREEGIEVRLGPHDSQLIILIDDFERLLGGPT